MAIETFAFYTITLLAPGDASRETSGAFDCQSPTVAGKEARVSECFTTPNNSSQPIESISPPETIATPIDLSGICPDSRNLGEIDPPLTRQPCKTRFLQAEFSLKTENPIAFENNWLSNGKDIADNPQPRLSFASSQASLLPPLMGANLTPNKALGLDKSQLEDSWNQPLGVFHTLLLDLTISPVGAIALFWLLKRFVIREMIAEAQKRCWAGNINGEFLHNFRLELEANLAKFTQGYQTTCQDLTQELIDQKIHLKEIQSVTSDWLTQVHTLRSEILQEKARQTHASETTIVQYPIIWQPIQTDNLPLNYNSSNSQPGQSDRDRLHRQWQSAEDWVQQGKKLCCQGQYEEAIAAYDTAIAMTPNRGDEAWFHRGNTLCFLQRYEEAIAAYDKSLEIQPYRGEVWYSRGQVFARLQRYSEALASYERATEINPLHSDYWHNLGNVMARLEFYDKAIVAYEKAISIKADKYEFWYNRGNALGKLHRYTQAAISYEKAIAIKPDKYEAWYNRGNALGRLQRYEEAIVSYDRAIAINPDNYEVWHNRGVMLGELQRYEAAIASYEKAIEIKSDNYESWHNRELSIEKLKRARSAKSV